MNKKNPKIDGYLRRAKKWQGEIGKLRRISLACGLTEETARWQAGGRNSCWKTGPTLQIPQRSRPSVQSTAKPYLPVPPDDPGGSPPWVACSCWRRRSSALALSTFKAAVSALPVSSTSTQRPPTWLPVVDGTQTMCFPLFTAALGPAQPVATKRTSPTKPICRNFVIIVIH
jgi:hypothetical protein